ncbi:MAG: TonB-dependent receptor domain-containing protein [Pyrinomonadaceae bacterium]
MNRGFSSTGRGLLIAIFVIAFSAIAFAQLGSGIRGVVNDSTGALVTGATVVLTNVETNQSLTTTTNDGGNYVFSGLPQGVYNVTVTLDGFKKQTIEGFTLAAETAARVNITLETGEVTAEVTVSGDEVPMLETENPNVSRNMTTREVISLPQVGRDPYQLARLAPGVFGDGARTGSGGSARIGNNGTGPGGSSNGIFAVENQPQISANGQRVTSNNYEVDGVSVNSQTWGGAAVITPTQESVSEVQVTSSTYSAEDGRNSGAQVKVITRYGTNDWHGSAFFKINDPSLNAYNKFYGNASNNFSQRPDRVNDEFKTYGGSFGGKIIQDKLFFFFAYEGTKNNTSSLGSPTFVETAAYRNALSTLRAGTLSSAFLESGAEPRIGEVLTPSCSFLSGSYASNSAYCKVVGNGLDIGSITGTYGTYVTDSKNFIGGGLDGVADLQYVRLLNKSNFMGNQYVFRMDYQATEKDRITFTSNVTPLKSSGYNSGAQSRPQADLTTDRLTYLLGGIWSRNISPTMLNEFRFNFTRWGFNELTSNPDTNWGLPRVEIEGIWGDRLRFGAPRAETTPADFKQTQMDFRDTITKIFGNHSAKAGVQYRRELNASASPGGARPLYSFTRMWNFANGTPIYEAIVADANGVPQANNVPFNSTNLGLFFQDDWKVKPNLTLNLGLRWEYLSPLYAGDDTEFGRLQLGEGSNALINAKIVTTNQLTKRDYNNFAPQLGFAWSPYKFNNKLVIRGGAGIGFDRLASALFSNVRFAPPNGARYGLCCGNSANAGITDSGTIQFVQSTDGSIYGYPANSTIGGGFGANGGPVKGSVEIYSTPDQLPSAFVSRYSLEAQYEIGWNTVATLGYSGSVGRHFVRILPLHLIYARNTNSTFRTVYFASPDVNTSYNSLIASIKRRFTSDFDLNVNYRFAKSLDTVSVEAPCACTNQTYPFDNSTEKGPSDFDVTHYLNITGTWAPSWFKGQKNIAGDLLAGWSFSPIITWRGGFPWTPVTGGGITISSDTASVGTIRPLEWYGTHPLTNDNSNFLNGVFPDNRIVGANCATGTGCSNYFLTTKNGNYYEDNVPGIGRNVFRGPRYFNVDLAIAKFWSLPATSFLGEAAKVEVRANFFNLFNNLNFTTFTAGSSSTRIDNVNFGMATSAYAGRVGEVQVRFSF